jgi:hypothetical protein
MSALASPTSFELLNRLKNMRVQFHLFAVRAKINMMRGTWAHVKDNITMYFTQTSCEDVKGFQRAQDKT